MNSLNHGDNQVKTQTRHSRRQLLQNEFKSGLLTPFDHCVGSSLAFVEKNKKVATLGCMIPTIMLQKQHIYVNS